MPLVWLGAVRGGVTRTIGYVYGMIVDATIIGENYLISVLSMACLPRCSCRAKNSALHTVMVRKKHSEETDGGKCWYRALRLYSFVRLKL